MFAYRKHLFVGHVCLQKPFVLGHVCLQKTSFLDMIAYGKHVFFIMFAWNKYAKERRRVGAGKGGGGRADGNRRSLFAMDTTPLP